MKDKRKRLTIDMDEKFHMKLKLVALKRNVTMRMLIIRAVLEYLKKEDKYN